MRMKARNKIDDLRLTESAEEIARQAVLSRNREDIDDATFSKWLVRDLRRGFEELEQRVMEIEDKSLPENRRSGFTGPLRNALRAEGIRSRRGFGDGCDTCGGPVKTFMSLTIGGWKARLVFDLCEPCAKRLAAVVDARLEDNTNCFRRRNGVLR